MTSTKDIRVGQLVLWPDGHYRRIVEVQRNRVVSQDLTSCRVRVDDLEEFLRVATFAGRSK